MLDVHPPEHGIHGVRDFLTHLLTITIGLLIALGLEASVEALHHRHLRDHAEATIRGEIAENQKVLVTIQANTEDEMKNLSRAMVFAEDLRSGKKDDPKGIQLEFNVAPLQDAGWTTANATGALNYMDYDEVQRFATAYRMQATYTESTAQALMHFEVLGTYLEQVPDPRDLKPQDIETAIPDLRRTQADLRSMHDFGRGLLRCYEDALKQ